MKEHSQDLSLKNQAALAGEEIFHYTRRTKHSPEMLWRSLKVLTGAICMAVVVLEIHCTAQVECTLGKEGDIKAGSANGSESTGPMWKT